VADLHPRRNSYAVQNMATGADKGQLLVLRALLLRDCYRPEFVGMETCSQEQRDSYQDLLVKNTEVMRFCHHGLYLGFSSLKQFADKRLMVSCFLSLCISIAQLSPSLKGLWTIDSSARTIGCDLCVWALASKFTCYDSPWERNDTLCRSHHSC
jgi:hypothetical protein